MKKWYVVSTAIIVVIVAIIFSIKLTEKPVLDGFFPQDTTVEFILTASELPDEGKNIKGKFQLNEVGQPTLLQNNIFYTLKNQKDQHTMPPFRVGGKQEINNYAWMNDGTLLMVAEKQLGGLTATGFKRILTLPTAGMKVEPATESVCYIFRGDTKEQQRNLYLYRKGGKLLHLLEAPEPITAVAGDGVLTFAAIGDSVFAVIADNPPVLVYTSDEKIVSLAASTVTTGIFFSTVNKVGYIYQRGQGYVFIKNKGGQVRVHNDDLYLFLEGEGILKVDPVTNFATLATQIKGSAL